MIQGTPRERANQDANTVRSGIELLSGLRGGPVGAREERSILEEQAARFAGPREPDRIPDYTTEETARNGPSLLLPQRNEFSNVPGVSSGALEA